MSQEMRPRLHLRWILLSPFRIRRHGISCIELRTLPSEYFFDPEPLLAEARGEIAEPIYAEVQLRIRV
jgi:hypothetical protein